MRAAPVSFHFGDAVAAAYRFDPESGACRQTGVDPLPEAGEGWVWLHLKLTDTRARHWLAHHAALPPAVAQWLLDGPDRVHLQRLDGCLVGAANGLHHDFAFEPDQISRLRFCLGPHLLVTGRRHPLRAVDEIRRSLAAGRAPATALGMLALIAEHLAAEAEAIVEKLMDEVDGIEDRVLDDRSTSRTIEDRQALGRIRRSAAALRRHLLPEGAAFAAGLNELPDWADPAGRSALSAAAERFRRAARSLDEVIDRARMLQEEIAAQRAEAMNRSLLVLAILTAVFLPMTLITGIFGMNVAGLPGLETPAAFLWVMLLILAAGVATLVLMFWRRMF
ncbi:CorA family divalent cation transporter [Inquilinus sp. CA228]|uniref:CorA family divalent cation transporter n=1 Tax=Inquilinus sp. CA228 TaxID=3455609 RepID=UPI003F8D4888